MSKKVYKENHSKAWAYFVYVGKIPFNAKKNEWCLHHKDAMLKYNDPQRYDEWRIEDLEPMLKSEHTRFHQKGNQHSVGHIPWNKNKELSEETKIKISEKSKALWKDPVYLEKQLSVDRSSIMKEHWQDKEYAARIKKSIKEFYMTDESEKSRKAISEKSKANWADKNYKDRVGAAIKKSLNTEEYKAKASEIQSDRIWYTDGKTDIKIKTNMQPPEGFHKGRSNFSFSKAVLKCDLDGNVLAEFDSQGDAARSIGLKSQANLSTAIKNQSLYKGFIWKFK